MANYIMRIAADNSDIRVLSTKKLDKSDSEGIIQSFTVIRKPYLGILSMISPTPSDVQAFFFQACLA
jgi:hypothetical protein